MVIELKTKDEIAIMREGGRILSKIFNGIERVLKVE